MINFDLRLSPRLSRGKIIIQNLIDYIVIPSPFVWTWDLAAWQLLIAPNRLASVIQKLQSVSILLNLSSHNHIRTIGFDAIAQDGNFITGLELDFLLINIVSRT